MLRMPAMILASALLLARRVGDAGRLLILELVD
jgi:hypothetical protein